MFPEETPNMEKDQPEPQRKDEDVGESTEYNVAHQPNQLGRALKSRHIQFIALGTTVPKSILFHVLDA